VVGQTTASIKGKPYDHRRSSHPDGCTWRIISQADTDQGIAHPGVHSLNGLGFRTSLMARRPRWQAYLTVHASDRKGGASKPALLISEGAGQYLDGAKLSERPPWAVTSSTVLLPGRNP
jgi:hypothetical protein